MRPGCGARLQNRANALAAGAVACAALASSGAEMHARTHRAPRLRGRSAGVEGKGLGWGGWLCCERTRPLIARGASQAGACHTTTTHPGSRRVPIARGNARPITRRVPIARGQSRCLLESTLHGLQRRHHLLPRLRVCHMAALQRRQPAAGRKMPAQQRGAAGGRAAEICWQIP